MAPLIAINHALNFVAPALAIALLVAALIKLIWRAELRGVRWLRLAGWGGAAALFALVVGIAVFGRDGMVATYIAAVLANAFAQWCVAFATPARRTG